MTSKAVTFRAAFPPIQSAIKVDGSGGGMRVQLDIPESEMPRALQLVAWREQVLIITIKPESLTKLDDETEKDTKRSSHRVVGRRAKNA